MELRPGGAARLHFRHANLAPDEEPPAAYRQAQEGIDCDCRITSCEKPRLLAFTWSGDPPSEVTFELTERGGQVELLLTHRRLDRAGMLDVSGGWHLHLAFLEARLAGREPPPFWATHASLAADYAARLAPG